MEIPGPWHVGPWPAVGPQARTARAVWWWSGKGCSSVLRGLKGMGRCVWLMLGRETTAATCLHSECGSVAGEVVLEVPKAFHCTEYSFVN